MTLDNAIKESMKDIKVWQREHPDQQATLLFAPAAASFDQWENFEMRGDAFRDKVKHALKEMRNEERA